MKMNKVQLFFLFAAINCIKADFKLSCDSSKSIGFGQISRIIDTNHTIFELTSNKKIAKENFKQFDVISALEYQAKSLTNLENRILNANENIPRIVDIVNDFYNARILELSKERISLNIDNLKALVEKSAINFITREAKQNVFLGFLVMKTVEDRLKKTLPIVRSVFDGKSVATSDISLHLTNQNKFRTCNLNIIQIIFQLIRLQIGKLLVPLQQIIIQTFTNITDYVMTFYVSVDSTSTSSVLTSFYECTNTFVSNVATVVTSVRETVNVVFNYIIYGTSTGIDYNSE